MKKDPPDESESKPGGSDTLASAGSLASVFVFNCSALSISVLNVNNGNVAPQGIAGINTPGSPPSCLQVPRTTFGTSALVAPTFQGITKPSWSQTVSINKLPNANMYLWCYLNGFMLADENGIISYMFGQSSLSLAMIHGSDEWPKKGRIISVAL
jgi:hypothetical protein